MINISTANFGASVHEENFLLVRSFVVKRKKIDRFCEEINYINVYCINSLLILHENSDQSVPHRIPRKRAVCTIGTCKIRREAPKVAILLPWNVCSPFSNFAKSFVYRLKGKGDNVGYN